MSLLYDAPNLAIFQVFNPGNPCLPTGPTLSAAIPKGQHLGPQHWIQLPTLFCRIIRSHPIMPPGLYYCSYLLFPICPNGNLPSPFQSFSGALCHSLALISN